MQPAHPPETIMHGAARNALVIAVAGWAFLALGVREARPQTMQIFPASSREDNAVHCVGNELNPVRFLFFAKDYGANGKYGIADIAKGQADQPLVLRVDVPEAVPYVGAVDFWKPEFMADRGSEKVTHDGRPYARHRILLDRAQITERIIKNKWCYHVTIWLKPPAETNSKIYWKLTEGDRVHVEAHTGLKSLGAMESDPALPKRFAHFEWYPEPEVPQEILKERVAFYRRTGVTHVNKIYSANGWDENARRDVRELRSAGIQVLAERGASFSEITGKFFTPECYRNQGLAFASAEVCRRITGEPCKKDFAAVAEWVDGSQWDYEEQGPGGNPGYDDPGTIKAFCKEKNLGELTPDQVKTRQAKEYFAYRMKLMGKPVFAFREMLRSVKPGLPIWLCQGGGVPIGDKIDYQTYDEAADYHVPMIYTSPNQFYRCVKRTAECVNPRKLVPATMVCGEYIMWCDKPGRLLLDYIGTASLGAAGLALWPGAPSHDGQQFYELYQGARMLAPVEAFYIEGRETGEVELKGLPYLEKKVDVGTRTIELCQPNWRQDLITKVHAHGDRRLLTLLNYHPTEGAYVEATIPSARQGQYVINPFRGVYVTVGGKPLIQPADLRKGVLIQVPSLNPSLWLLTGQAKDLQGLKPLAMEQLRQEFERRKAAVASQPQAGDVPVGKQGDLAVRYAEVKDQEGGSQVCVEVASPLQTIAFTSSGGRIWQWTVGGKDLVARSMEQGGVGMDLIWLPVSGRWTGDQKAEMTLMKAVNTGQEVQLTYQGALKSVKLDLEKTYRVPANGTRVDVRIKLTNADLVTPTPAQVAYWSHNYFAWGPTGSPARSFMAAAGNDVVTAPSGPTSQVTFTNEKQGQQYRPFIMANMLKGAVRNVFGEYAPALKLGVLVRIPEDFMQVYRYEGPNESSTLEWMHRPVVLGPGKSVELSFEMEIYPGADADQFKETIRKRGAIPS